MISISLQFDMNLVGYVVCELMVYTADVMIPL